MSKIAEYQEKLHRISQWDAYLLQESGLPGPRGNIELAQAVANVGDRDSFVRYLGFTADIAPINSPFEFLAFCGTLGIGRLLAEGDLSWFQVLRSLASDSRWRIREGVAMALQRLGDTNMARLLVEMADWSRGTALEQRAAAAALCEPRLLVNLQVANQVLDILDWITSSILVQVNRRGDDFIALRKGLGYCWSVAVVASPVKGKKLMEKWLGSRDKDIRWIMRQNLGKSRLERMDAEWVVRCTRGLIPEKES
jgi:hypothetical protein